MKQRFVATKWSPGKLYLFLLVIVFLCEFAVMLLLPIVSVRGWPGWVVGALDAALLTTLLVPTFGWLIVRPLQHMASIRAHLLEHLISAQEEERGRIARDLHDEIGQAFTLILLRLRAIEREVTTAEAQQHLDELTVMVSQSLNEVRRLARGLRPAVLDHAGLVQAIEQYLEEFQRLHPLQVTLTSAGYEDSQRHPSAIETVVYRIVQESLTNIVKHSGAQHAHIELRRGPRELSLRVTDDGRGIVESRDQSSQSTGLLGMAERAALVHGTLQVTSTTDGGTCVALHIPLPEVLVA